jgi:hypothetical protein
MSNGYSLRTYNTTGVLVQVRRSTAEDPAGDAAAAQLRAFGATINAVRGQKGWRSDLLLDGKRVAMCRNGRWVEVMS